MSDNNACATWRVSCGLASERIASPKGAKRWAPHSRFHQRVPPSRGFELNAQPRDFDGLPFARAAGGRAPEAVFLSSVPTAECPGIVSGPGG